MQDSVECSSVEIEVCRASVGRQQAQRGAPNDPAEALVTLSRPFCVADRRDGAAERMAIGALRRRKRKALNGR
ncbi:hypothetical protein E2C01_083429 [Portunus trituberculatus]|uniref:Uncharacterized protein n=1 Tax=Portunus trituberculatus TaxID=210409 RepID=A0A5B7J201_PORTR|nr:hypothetical protein [Portunus trituberculatus]